MPIMKKKKKKKEEFDASLMGGYLPGLTAVSTSEPVSAVLQMTQRMPDFLQFNYRYMPVPGTGDRGPEPEEIPLARQFIIAWGFYGMAGIADPKNFAEASVWSRVLGVPYVAGYIVAGLIGFGITGLILTAVDPLHKWEGGLDETAFYERRVTNAVRKPEWGSNDPWYWKAKEEHGWGASL